MSFVARKNNAAAARRAAQGYAQTVAAPTTLPQRHLDKLEAYRAANVPAADRTAVRDAVRGVMGRAGHITGYASFTKRLSDVAALAMWARRQNRGLTWTDLMNHVVIRDFAIFGMPDTARRNHGARVQRLLALASRINPGPTAPPMITASSYRDVDAPYTAAEEAALLRALRTQRRSTTGQRVRLVVALARGAGARAVDLRHATIADIDDRNNSGIWVTLGSGHRRRTVPVRRAYEAMVRKAITGRAPHEPVCGSAARNAVNGLLAQVDLLGSDTPDRIQVSRLRTAYIANLMLEAIPLAVLLKAAGLTSARTLTGIYEVCGLAHSSVVTEALAGDTAQGDAS